MDEFEKGRLQVLPNFFDCFFSVGISLAIDSLQMFLALLRIINHDTIGYRFKIEDKSDEQDGDDTDDSWH